MEDKIVMSISILPENKDIVLLKSNIVDISSSIINNRIFIKYKDKEEIKICSCFIYLSVSEELQVNDYFLINNEIKVVNKVFNNEIEYIECYDDNIVLYSVLKNKCKKIVGSTKNYQEFFRISIENSFIKNLINNYKIDKKLPIKCKIKSHFRRVNDRTILVYLQEQSEFTFINLFKNIVKNMKINSNCTYETIISIWRRRMIKKINKLSEVNRIHDDLENLFKNYYELNIIK